MTNNIQKQSEPIKGKVSGVLNERELSINIGTKAGVRVGMKFRVLADKALEVHDPETDELLGTIDREKVQVQATEVFEKFSICKTFRKFNIGGAGMSSLSYMSSLFTPRREVYETLKAEDSTLPPPLSEKESYVKKGDRVMQAIEVEE